MATDKMVRLAPDDGWVDLSGEDITSAITCIHRGGAGDAILKIVPTGTTLATDDIRGLPIEGGSRDGHPSGFLNKALTDMTLVASPVRAMGRALGGEVFLYFQSD